MVNNISSISKSIGMEDLFRVFSEVIQRSCHSICATWQEKEFSLLKGNANKELASIILEKVKGDNTIAQSITRFGFDGMDSIYASPEDFKSIKQRDRIRGIYLLEYFVNRCHEIGVAYQAWIKHGDPKEVICHEVKQVPVMGLVCGSRLRILKKKFCEFCGKYVVKRKVIGIWGCKDCGKVKAGSAYTLKSCTSSFLVDASF